MHRICVSFIVSVLALITFACGVAPSIAPNASMSVEAKEAADALGKNARSSEESKKHVIQIAANSPAEAVKMFYRNLREKRFREALMMTNLRPAIDGLTDAEIADLRTDFEVLAEQIPEEIGINGEIISGSIATVTARMPNDETGAMELKEFKVRREGEQWIVLTADDATEAAAKKEGKNYFFNLRIEVHHSEVKKVLQNISRAELIYSVKNNGALANLETLVQEKLLSPETLVPETLGYRFRVSISNDGKKYTAFAEPTEYGKTGKLSFILESESKNGKTHLNSEDKKGAPLKN